MPQQDDPTLRTTDGRQITVTALHDPPRVRLEVAGAPPVELSHNVALGVADALEDAVYTRSTKSTKATQTCAEEQTGPYRP